MFVAREIKQKLRQIFFWTPFRNFRILVFPNKGIKEWGICGFGFGSQGFWVVKDFGGGIYGSKDLRFGDKGICGI